MMNIVAGIMFILLLVGMAFLVIYPIHMCIIDSYYFKARYVGISGHCHIEYFSVRAASLKRAYEKARRYANESCMSHEYIDYISLM